MRPPRIAKPFAGRLPGAATDADLARMAWNPSYRAPRAADLLRPPPFALPLPRLSPAERQHLDAVLADPDADAPRLAFADWCDANADPRGPLIRHQIGLSRRSTQMNADQKSKHDFGSDLRSSALICGETAWLSWFAPWSAADVEFRRGFPEAMSLTGRGFVTLGEPLFRLAPLRDVRLVAASPFVAELARVPHLAKLDRLSLAGCRVGPAGVRELAASPFVRLTALDLSRNGLGADGVRELRRADWLGRLRALSVAGNDLTPAAAADLLDAPDLADLTDLDASANALGPAVAAVLPRTAVVCLLRRLALAGNRVGPGGAAAFFASPRLDRLRDLDLSDNAVGPGGAASLAECESLTGLRRLDLAFNDAEDAGCESLAASANLFGLRRLRLRANRITSAGAAALAGSAWLGNVEALDLGANKLGDAGAAAVAAGFESLRELDLSNNGISDAGPLAAGLKALSLAWNPLTDAGVAALAADPAAAGLGHLDLTGTPIGTAAAKALYESPHLSKLRVVLGENPRLPAAAAGMLADRFGTTCPSPPGGRAAGSV